MTRACRECSITSSLRHRCDCRVIFEAFSSDLGLIVTYFKRTIDARLKPNDGFCIRTMYFVFKMMYFVFKMMYFVFKMMYFVFKMMSK